jgi:hypothetical protein
LGLGALVAYDDIHQLNQIIQIYPAQWAAFGISVNHGKRFIAIAMALIISPGWVTVIFVPTVLLLPY